MATETLTIPEENLQEVILIIRAGLDIIAVSKETQRNLLKWCNETEKYLKELRED